MPVNETAFYRRLATVSSIGKTAAVFAALIGVGTLLLMLPWARRPGIEVPWLDTLFLATSAACVTGLTTVNVGESYTLFGQAVILGLIQAGGLGIMTAGTLFLLIRGRGSRSRSEDFIGANVGRLREARPTDVLVYACFFVVLIELSGTVALTYLLLEGDENLGFGSALWEAAFHSISAFCNAGISTYPEGMVRWQEQPLALLVTCVLVIAGGIGLLTLVNFRYYYFWRSDRMRRGHLTLQTVLCLSVSAVLLAGGTLLTWAVELENTLTDVPWWKGILLSFFHSVMTRTAGFSVVDPARMEPVTLLGSLPLMLIGGCPGGMAGGVKVTTLVLLVAAAWSALRRRLELTVGRRTLPHRQADAAVMIVLLSGMVLMVAFGGLMQTELGRPAAMGPHGWLAVVFEAVSAFGTVGLSAGITSQLTVGGKLIIIVLMFVGRLGPLCLAMHLTQPAIPARVTFPEEEVAVG